MKCLKQLQVKKGMKVMRCIIPWGVAATGLLLFLPAVSSVHADDPNGYLDLPILGCETQTIHYVPETNL